MQLFVVVLLVMVQPCDLLLLLYYYCEIEGWSNNIVSIIQ